MEVYPCLYYIFVFINHFFKNISLLYSRIALLCVLVNLCVGYFVKIWRWKVWVDISECVVQIGTVADEECSFMEIICCCHSFFPSRTCERVKATAREQNNECVRERHIEKAIKKSLRVECWWSAGNVPDLAISPVSSTVCYNRSSPTPARKQSQLELKQVIQLKFCNMCE